MNKRQLKKIRKKYLPVVADEFNLMLMTDEENEKAHKEYNDFKKKYAYRKKYKDLKGKHLTYFYPMAKTTSNFLSEVSKKIGKGNNIKSHIVTQKLTDFEK